MIKTIGHEFPEILTSIVVYQKNSDIEEEIHSSDQEVVFNRGKRFVVSLLESDLPSSQFQFPNNSVVLVTGGAQGITYEMVKSIANTKSDYILIGRTSLRSDARQIAQMDDIALTKRKSELLVELKTQGMKVTPVVLEKEWNEFIKSGNIWTALEELTNKGNKTNYISMDVGNSKSIKNGFNQIKKILGTKEISHFIHGAGLEISRPTLKKTPQEFDLVYNVKVKGFDEILSYLNVKQLKRVIAFTSVSGRFGNATQIDYAAANENLVKRCEELRQNGIPATAISWSVWADIGMATRGSTMTVLDAIGVTLIPVKEGIRRFVEEFEHGVETEVVISGKLGELGRFIKWYIQGNHPSPMIDSIEKSKHQATRILSLKVDKYLNDHRIQGKAVLPGVMGLEAISEMANAIQNKNIQSMNHIKFLSPVKLPRDKDLEIIIEKDQLNDNQYFLKSKFIGPDGTQLGALRQHFWANVTFGNPTNSYPVMKEADVKKSLMKLNTDAKAIYSQFFHGPSYQVIDKLTELTTNSAVCKMIYPKNKMFVQDVELLINPLAIEAGFQTAGLHLLSSKSEIGLPSGIKQITWFANTNDPVLVRAIYLDSLDNYSYYDIELIDRFGNCVIRIDKYEMIHTGESTDPNSAAQIKQDPNEIEVHVKAGQLDLDLIVIDTNALETVSEQFIDSFLTQYEKSRYNDLKIKKKRLEWLGGRIAAKIAISKDFNLSYQEINIQKDENRSPFIEYKTKKVHVSITHSHGKAIACIGDKTVDLEEITKRSNSFVNEAFSKDETTRLGLNDVDPKLLTKYWTMKEAHLKRMRIGLKTDLHKVVIQNSSDVIGEVFSEHGKSQTKSIEGNKFIITVANKIE